MAGIIDMPMPKPRMTMAAPSSQNEVVASISTNGSVATIMMLPPSRLVEPAAEALGDAAGGGHRERGADALRDQQQAGHDASSPRTSWK